MAGDGTSPAPIARPSAHRKLQQFDRIEVLHAAAHPLGRVEQHIGLGAIGIAQHADASAVHDQVSAAEIAEGDGQRAGGDIRHVLRLRAGESR